MKSTPAYFVAFLVCACSLVDESKEPVDSPSLQLNAHCDSNTYDTTLRANIASGDLDAVKKNLQGCASLERVGESYFWQAWGNDSMVIYLLANGADTSFAVGFDGMDLFEQAIFDRRDTLVDFFLAEGYVPGDDAIAYAASNKDSALLDTLLGMGLHVNNANWLSLNNPILYHLCSFHLTQNSAEDYVPIAITLLDAGADPSLSAGGIMDCAPNAGWDALQSCSRSVNETTDSLLLPVIQRMVRNGADPLRPKCLDSVEYTTALEQSKDAPLVHAFLDSVVNAK